jgi:hypothetical protein
MGFFPRNPEIDTQLQTAIVGTTSDECHIAHVQWDDPAAPDEDGTGLGSVATSNTAVTEVDVSSITQPDYPRNVVINPSDLGTVTDGAAGNITITGTNIAGEVVSEAIAVVENQAHDTKSVGDVAFATITAISIPQQDGPDAEYYFGYGNKLGLPYARETLPVIATYHDTTLEATAATVAADADNLERNTVALDTALDGSQVDVYLVV